MRHFLSSDRRRGRQENEPRRRIGARWRGSGHGYYFLLRKSFLTGSRKIAHKIGYFLSRPRGGLKTAARALVKELVQTARIHAAVAAAFGIFSRLEVTHVNFLFLLFAHITFLSCVFGFGLC